MILSLHVSTSRLSLLASTYATLVKSFGGYLRFVDIEAIGLIYLQMSTPYDKQEKGDRVCYLL
jgi:type III secretory pathway component EscV